MVDLFSQNAAVTDDISIPPSRRRHLHTEHTSAGDADRQTRAAIFALELSLQLGLQRDDFRNRRYAFRSDRARHRLMYLRDCGVFAVETATGGLIAL